MLQREFVKMPKFRGGPKVEIFFNHYDHYLGTNNDCNICKSYIDKGDLIYEL